MSTVMHDFNEPTTCCGRSAHELPLGDGRTTAADGVTCDGTFVPALLAHEVYEHPSEWGDEPPDLLHAIRYSLTRALALYPSDRIGDDSLSREWMDRINLHLAQRDVACLLIALHKGLTGQEALDWAHRWSCGDTSELIYDLAVEYGVPLDRIRPYAMRTDPVSAPATQGGENRG